MTVSDLKKYIEHCTGDEEIEFEYDGITLHLNQLDFVVQFFGDEITKEVKFILD